MVVLPQVDVWTDASARAPADGTRYVAGCAFVALFDGRRVERWWCREETTVNQAELLAIYGALVTVKLTRHPVKIYTDSQYACKSLNEYVHKWRRCGWVTSRGQPVLNRNLIERVMFHVERHRKVRSLRVEHVPGHAGITENERADHLAGEARKGHLSNMGHELPFLDQYDAGSRRAV